MKIKRINDVKKNPSIYSQKIKKKSHSFGKRTADDEASMLRRRETIRKCPYFVTFVLGNTTFAVAATSSVLLVFPRFTPLTALSPTVGTLRVRVADCDSRMIKISIMGIVMFCQSAWIFGSTDFIAHKSSKMSKLILH